MFKFKKSAIFIVGVSLLYALFNGGEVPYFLFYAALLLVVLSFFWTRAVIKRLSVTQRVMREHAYVGDEVEIKTMVFNESLLPVPYIEVKNDMIQYMTGRSPVSNVLSLMPIDSRSVIEKVKCRYRGYYTFGPVRVSISDLFGMFTWNREIRCEGIISVYPRVANLENFNIRPMQMFGTVTTKQKANEDYSSISDIRKYYPGDSFKRIHWKVSARKGALHVKNFDMSGSAESHIFLNLYKNDYADVYRADIEEKAVECTATIIHYMLLKNINTALYTNCSRITYTRGRDIKELKKFMEELITVKSNGNVPMEELLEARSRLISKGSSIIIVTPVLHSRLSDKLSQLKETGFDVIVVYISADNPIDERVKNQISLLESLNIKTYRVGINDDVRSSLEG